jgi:hypothetical protein
MRLSYAVPTALFLLSTPAAAYIGPGAGAGAIGVLIAVVLGATLLVVGFLWYPLKRVMRRRRAVQNADPDSRKE